MSEGNHSANPSQPRRRFVSLIAGTGVAGVAAGLAFQFFRAEPAHSQTQQPAKQPAAPQTTQPVMARVNNQPIYYDAVAKESVNRVGPEVLDNLINRLIILQECDRRGITVSQEEVTREVTEIAKKFNLPPDTWYQMLQSERNISPQQYRDDVIWPMLALKKLAGTEFKPTNEDMDHAFKRDYGPRVKARVVLVDGNIRQANEVWQECTSNPDDFDRIAREKSADPNTRALGGVVPPIRMFGAPEQAQVEQAAFKLRSGEISPVIEIDQNRYLIMKCEGRTEPVVTDIKDVWDELYKQVVEEKTQSAVATVFEKIKKDAQVQNFLVNTTTGIKKPAAPAGRPAAGEVPGAATTRPAAATGKAPTPGALR
ncbi:MAG TPA: peptidylprolyl isomerase [Caulifigura sp.]|nr:peptidylprolyl isomerase [Caulifigura sp.]